MANGVASGAYADCASWTPARAWRGRSNDHVAAVGSSRHWVGRWLKNWYETPGALTPTSDAPRAHWPAGGAGPPPADGHDQPQTAAAAAVGQGVDPRGVAVGGAVGRAAV